MFVLIIGTYLASVHKQLRHRVDRHTNHAGGRAEGVSFDQGGDDGGSLGGVELVHNEHYASPLKHSQGKKQVSDVISIQQTTRNPSLIGLSGRNRNRNSSSKRQASLLSSGML